MKKQVKLVTTILMIITLMFSIANIALGVDSAMSTMRNGLKNGGGAGGTAVANLGATIVGIMQVVGVVVAVVVILVIGIKYLIGSAEERAEYKKTMIPYLVGAVLIFASTTIVNVIYNLANSVNDASTAG